MLIDRGSAWETDACAGMLQAAIQRQLHSALAAAQKVIELKDRQIAELEASVLSARETSEDKAQQIAHVEASLEAARKCGEEKDRQLSKLEFQENVCAPFMKEVNRFAQCVPDIVPTAEPIMVPVAALRFTHHTVNSDLAFGEGHENRQESIFKLIDALFRGTLVTTDLEPLDVFLHNGPDGARGLYSRNNRRLLALLWLQAVRRDEALRVPCRIHHDDDPGLARWFKEGYDAPGGKPGCNGLGLSIWPRPGSACHRGYELFNPPATACRALQRACDREQARLDFRPDLVDALTLVAEAAKRRTLHDHEETLTFRSDSPRDGQGWAEEQRGKGRRTGKAGPRLGRGSTRQWPQDRQGRQGAGKGNGWHRQ
ncbi:unnamed protein product [Polarella glacialis]|uniref:Uncharacterized protein n=1 Tax=Polarella glacialis TaxID=89957 RepID=A0A813KVX4_POLGL|nr:unnamed protein product [Polarella glacialis]